MKRIKRLFLTILGFPLTTYRDWRLARRGYSKYIKIPTPEELAQAQAAAWNPDNPASFAALAAKSNARTKEAEDSPIDVGEWGRHIAETGLHPLEAGVSCACPAQHILATSPLPQLPEAIKGLGAYHITARVYWAEKGQHQAAITVNDKVVVRALVDEDEAGLTTIATIDPGKDIVEVVAHGASQIKGPFISTVGEPVEMTSTHEATEMTEED